MNIVSHSIRPFLNQPIIKEGIKTIAGSVTFAFGLDEIYDIYQMTQSHAIEMKPNNSPKWIQVAHKIIVICAKISFILSAGVSRPGIFIISSLFGCVFSTEQLNQVFGPNTTFAINPWHPRHVLSLVAGILGLPSLLLLDKEAKKMLFNTITSRPILHLGNKLL